MQWPLAPMKATPAALPRGDDWVYEPKWDGHRAMVRVSPDGHVDAVSSSGNSRIAQWPWLADVASALDNSGAGDWILDGEVVAMGDDGRHAFQFVGRPDRPHAFVAFDLLAADGADLRQQPWHVRRSQLESTLRTSAHILITPVADDPDAMLAATLANGFEGVIAKRRTAAYQPGRRSPAWVKVKHRVGQEFVVGGYLLGNGSRAQSLGSLLVGVYDEGVLRFCGAIGSGFNDRSLAQLRSRLDVIATDHCPFDPPPAIPRKTARWVRPDLVVQAEFAEWTAAGHLRHPVFLGLRDDVAPQSITREAL
jgi:bifunctional non-homologous end joining protein LigD